MRATTIHAPGDIRLSDVPDPTIDKPTDAIIKVAAGCICGSDLWPYRGANDVTPGDTIGHECVGIVEEVGSEVTSFRAGTRDRRPGPGGRRRCDRCSPRTSAWPVGWLRYAATCPSCWNW